LPPNSQALTTDKMTRSDDGEAAKDIAEDHKQDVHSANPLIAADCKDILLIILHHN